MSAANPYRGKSVKRNLLHFFVGRAGSAGITFFSFAAIAHWLPLAEYGLYMLALAIFEVCFALCLFGFEWVSARMIPEARIQAGFRQLNTLIRGILVVQVVAMLSAALVLHFASGYFAAWLNEPRIIEVTDLLAIFLLLEGVARLFRDQVLAALMLQGLAQVGQILRNCIVLLSVMAAHWFNIAATAHHMLYIELVAALIACLFALAAYLHELAQLKTIMPKDSAYQLDWGAVRRLSLSAYTNYLCTLPTSPWVITFLLSRFVGVEFVAVYGFARAFADQVRRYIPIFLLSSIMQPVLAAHWSETQDRVTTGLRLSLLYKWSLLSIVPLITLFTLWPVQAASALGGHKMASAGSVLLLFMALIIFNCMRRVAEISCHLVGRAEITAKVSLGMVLAFPIIYLGLSHGWGGEFVLMVMIATELYFIAVTITILHRTGYGFPLQLKGVILSAVFLTVILYIARLIQPIIISNLFFGLFVMLCIGISLLLVFTRLETKFMVSLMPQRVKAGLFGRFSW